MDVLVDDGSDDDSSDGDSATEHASTNPPSGTKNKTLGQKVRLEDLEKAGYQSGPSVLHIRAPAREEPECSWAWADGAAAKEQETTDTAEVRIIHHFNVQCWSWRSVTR